MGFNKISIFQIYSWNLDFSSLLLDLCKNGENEKCNRKSRAIMDDKHIQMKPLWFLKPQWHINTYICVHGTGGVNVNVSRLFVSLIIEWIKSAHLILSIFFNYVWEVYLFSKIGRFSCIKLMIKLKKKHHRNGSKALF